MRVDLLTPIVEVRAEQRGLIELEILNDSDVIEQVVCSVPSLPTLSYEVSPLALTLFPGESGRMVVGLDLPRTYPMGPHEFQVFAYGRMTGTELQHSVEVRVHELRDVHMNVAPKVVTGRKKGKFYVNVENRGNATASVLVRTSDAENKLNYTIEPDALIVEPGQRRAVQVIAKGRRPFFGSPRYNSITVTGEFLPEVIADQAEFRQKARLTTGMITVLTLGLIIGAWAVALLFAAQAAFGSEPPKKTVAEGFANGVDVTALDPATIGGSLGGVITAESNGTPLGRITIELYNSKNIFVTAVASGPDGAYKLDAVLPGRYRLRYRAVGFDELWFPAATTITDSEQVLVAPLTPREDLDVKLAGGGGSLTATVIAGDSVVPVTVKITPADLPDAEPLIRQVDSGSPFVIEGLATPATYRIEATADAYQPTEITQLVEAGAAVTANPIRLVASSGVIRGVVVDLAGQPLGDVTVTTMVGDKPVQTITPTAGEIGAFVLSELPTPGTYVLEFERVGYAKVVTAVRLGPGGSDPTQQIVMGSATGTINGVVSADGVGVGGVTVTVTGGGFSTSVTSFTDNPPGSFAVTGLPVPGEYVLTFSTPGRVSTSLAVSIAADNPTVSANADMLPALSRVFGKVVDGQNANVAVGGAIVDVSDGATVRSTVTSNVGASLGTFEVPGLPPGLYTITATFPGRTPVTYLVTVDVNPELPGASQLVVLGS